MRTTADLQRARSRDDGEALRQEEHSAALSPLASRISAVLKFGAGAGEAPFEKVQALITDLLNGCRRRRRRRRATRPVATRRWRSPPRKKEDLEAQVAKRSSKLESAIARSNILDGEVAELQADLGALSAQQLKMCTMRAEERKNYATAKEDVEQGIAGVQKAAGILRDFHGASLFSSPMLRKCTRARAVRGLPSSSSR